jgi:integral membrane protein
VQLFRVVATAEAVSWLGLLAGMYLKYVTEAGELGVQVFGPLHGGIFLAYLLLTLLVARSARWNARTTVVGLACSVPPFATLAFELWAQRTGRLAGPAQRPAGAQPDPAGLAGERS